MTQTERQQLIPSGRPGDSSTPLGFARLIVLRRKTKGMCMTVYDSWCDLGKSTQVGRQLSFVANEPLAKKMRCPAVSLNDHSCILKKV